VRHGRHGAIGRLLVLAQHLLLKALAHHRRHDIVRVFRQLPQPLLKHIVHLRVMLVLFSGVRLQSG
jgi:hypothetical protein